ncbi:hypothetical protein [Avibacterium paragallinarum]|uniref:hypothetical protein n=1 Tax=Avibacterium paragallinarum TaxID=728 RepID=UPI002113A9FB|nr:hypothetical protein [Avibacterium paragallinarum]
MITQVNPHTMQNAMAMQSQLPTTQRKSQRLPSEIENWSIKFFRSYSPLAQQCVVNLTKCSYPSPSALGF